MPGSLPNNLEKEALEIIVLATLVFQTVVLRTLVLQMQLCARRMQNRMVSRGILRGILLRWILRWILNDKRRHSENDNYEDAKRAKVLDELVHVTCDSKYDLVQCTYIF